MSWNARETADQRQQYETNMQAYGSAGLVMSERNNNGERVPVSDRADYFPITFSAEQVRQLVQQRTLELSGILNNTAEAILMFDESGYIECANATAQQLFGG